MRKYITALVVFMFAVLSLVSTADSAKAVPSLYDYPWTTVASAGTVDEGDISIYQVNGANMDIKSSAGLPAYLNVRYNLVGVGQLLYYGGGPSIKVRYRDNGGGGRVYLSLKQVNLTTGVESTMLNFNSNSFPQSGSIQTRIVRDCGRLFSFNFWKNAYYIDAFINKTGDGGTPLLNTIQVSSSFPCFIIAGEGTETMPAVDEDK